MRRTVFWLVAATSLVLVWIAYSRLSPVPPGQGDHKQIESGRDLNGPQFPEGLPDEAVPRLRAWLQVDSSQSARLPSRDIFDKASRPVAVPIVAPPPSSDTAPPVELDRPRLTGFVFSGGRVDRPLAAIRFEGRMWLVGVGEFVGPFRVEGMMVGEETHLIHQETGESLRLTLK